jgi:DNA-binding SARP family transcriptional activator
MLKVCRAATRGRGRPVAHGDPAHVRTEQVGTSSRIALTVRCVSRVAGRSPKTVVPQSGYGPYGRAQVYYAAPMRYRVLGPLSIVSAGEPVTISAGRDRVVLAMLLVRPGHIVPLSRIVEAVWGSTPPATARGQVHTCVSRLRRVLPADAILSDPAGYGIRVAPDELDALVFARLVDEARAAAGPGDARDAYRQALDLWRGEAFAEIDSPAVRQAAATLDEQYTHAAEDWAALELAEGRARELLADLVPLVERFPLRERLRGQLMQAYQQTGRQADALAEYRRARETLRDELGIDPGPDLQAVHREILSGTSSDAIRCLPRTVRDFTGRAALTDRLLESVDAGEPAIVVDGMAGSGKTTLALHVAARVGDRFPDAHLFVDLHGHSEQDPVEPSAALLVLLRQLGLSAETIPGDLAGRLALWRNEVSRRRVLVVLDNAAASDQVADLLPSSPGSIALVTSRRRLVGLDGVRPEPVPLLDPGEAITLLERIAGERVRADPAAAAEVVRRCGGLPLAVRLAGARLAQRPRWRVADLVRRLGDAALPELAVENRTLISAFALSYSHLDGPARRFFRLLGVYPGALIDAPAAAALTGLSLSEAGDLLDELVDVHLIEEPAPGVYRLHDLLREYAAALVADGEHAPALLGALNLETHALLATVTGVQRPLVARDMGNMPPPRADLLPAITDPEARLERQRPDLGAFMDAAAAAGDPRYAWWIPRAAWYLLFYRGYNQDVAQLSGRALTIARANGDDAGIAAMAKSVASYHYRTGAYEQARRHLSIAMEIWERDGEPTALAVGHSNLAAIQSAMNRYSEAAESALRSLHLAARSRRSYQMPVALFQLSIAYQRLGRYREALRIDRLRLLAVERDEGHERAGCLIHIQRSKLRLGLITPPAAQRYVELALGIVVRRGLPTMEMEARAELGNVLAEQGRYAEALVHHRRAVELAEQVGEIRTRADILHDRASTLLRSGDTGAARDGFELSLATARRWDQPYAIARAAAGLADCLEPADPERARRLRAESRALFDQIGCGHASASAGAPTGSGAATAARPGTSSATANAAALAAASSRNDNV